MNCLSVMGSFFIHLNVEASLLTEAGTECLRRHEDYRTTFAMLYDKSLHQIFTLKENSGGPAKLRQLNHFKNITIHSQHTKCAPSGLFSTTTYLHKYMCMCVYSVYVIVFVTSIRCIFI